MPKTFDEVIVAIADAAHVIGEESWREDGDGTYIDSVARLTEVAPEALADLRDAYEVRERARAGLEYAQKEQSLEDGGINLLTYGDYVIAERVLRRILGTDDLAATGGA